MTDKTRPAVAHAAAQQARAAAFAATVRDAAKGTGADFATILTKAAGESRFNPTAKNPKSTATGAFQFIERTWLDMVRRHGDSVGLGAEAAQIGVDAKGKPTVADPAARKAILDLRKDPRISATMAQRYAEENRQALRKSLHRDPSQNEVAMAFLLGASGAGRLLRTAQSDPDTPADQIIPGAVAANPTLFKKSDGTVRTAAEARDFLDRRFTAERQKVQPIANVASLFVPAPELEAVG